MDVHKHIYNSWKLTSSYMTGGSSQAHIIVTDGC